MFSDNYVNEILNAMIDFQLTPRAIRTVSFALICISENIFQYLQSFLYIVLIMLNKVNFYVIMTM